jgi:protein-S-isoprenylcysteine O-methyltransferase Ste14
MVIKFILFISITSLILWISWPSLRNIRAHGFYRFFAWESILILFLINAEYWFVDPFALKQIVAWILLVGSLLTFIPGVVMLRQLKADQTRDDPALLGMEKTAELADTGVYRYIRHPLYSSLLFLAWGTFFKNPSWVGFALGAVATLALVGTTKTEEIENLAYWGEEYQAYMEKTKRFIPFLF